jgi:hypothetical protein
VSVTEFITQTESHHMKFRIKVSDQRGKYLPRTYEVEASEAMAAYGEATNRYIKDNNHPPYKPGKRVSVYFSRFWNEIVPTLN